MTNKKLLWLDLEMSGLDEKKHHILEIAAMVTDLHFNPLETIQCVVKQPSAVLEAMDDWCKKTHGESGLTAKVLGPDSIELVEAEQMLVRLVEGHFNKDQRPVLAGNSIWNDRRFIDAQLPKFSAKLHYRMVDVSSFKEIFRERFGIKFDKQNKHQAIEDIGESIAELKHYLTFFKMS